MLQHFNLTQFISQSIRCGKIIIESYDFFIQNKLWRGIFKHKWVVLFTVVLSILFTYALFSDLYDYIFSSPADIEIDDEDGASISKVGNLATTIFGGSKFLLLILLEIVIFHFSVKTLEVLNDEEYETTFSMFLSAEWRMIKVMLRGAIYAFICQIVLNIILGILGFSDLLPALMFIVHAYVIGYSFFDNYNEQQKLNIKESDVCIRHNSGAATTLGIVASVGLLVPILGALLVPIFGAIAANIYGFRYHIENPPHHLAQKKEAPEKAPLV